MKEMLVISDFGFGSDCTSYWSLLILYFLMKCISARKVIESINNRSMFSIIICQDHILILTCPFFLLTWADVAWLVNWGSWFGP